MKRQNKYCFPFHRTKNFVYVKKNLFEHCANHLNNNLLSLEKRRLELLEALESESKNSAGDNHETGRSMLQLDREKLGEQIKKTERNLQLLIPLQNGGLVHRMKPMVRGVAGKEALPISI